MGAFRLDLKKRRLTRGDAVISLTPREFDVLLFLIENAGRVSKKTSCSTWFGRILSSISTAALIAFAAYSA